MKLTWKSPLNFLEFCWLSARRLIKGERVFVPEQTAACRLEVCECCIYFDPEYRQCAVCTCFMDLKVKFDGVDCPRNFWSKPCHCNNS